MTTLYVSNLPMSVTAKELSTLFGSFGEPCDVQMEADDSARVTYASTYSANRAREALNGIRFNGFVIRIKLQHL